MSSDKVYKRWSILNGRCSDQKDMGVYRIKQDIRGRWDVESQHKGRLLNQSTGLYEDAICWRTVCTHKYKWQARRVARRLKNPKIEII